MFRIHISESLKSMPFVIFVYFTNQKNNGLLIQYAGMTKLLHYLTSLNDNQADVIRTSSFSVKTKVGGTVKIRQYKESDLESVLDAWEVATRLAHEFMADDFLAQERKNVAEIYLPNTETWVAEVDGDVKGFIALIDNEVGALFLQPNCHGKGIGKALMDKAQELHGTLEVEVFKENAIGRSFYSKYGFELEEEKYHEPTGQQVLRLKFAANKESSAAL